MNKMSLLGRGGLFSMNGLLNVGLFLTALFTCVGLVMTFNIMDAEKNKASPDAKVIKDLEKIVAMQMLCALFLIGKIGFDMMKRA